jgi:phosphoglycolate phosphatase
VATIACAGQRFPNIQAIIFDKDGTLADSAHFLRDLTRRRSRLIDQHIPGLQETLMQTFGLRGDRLDLAGLMAVGTREENLAAAAGCIAATGKSWADALAIARLAFEEADRPVLRKADQTPLLPGVRELLANLITVGVKVAILSSDSTANVEDFGRRYQLQPYVQAMQGIDTPPGKPDPHYFYRVCEAIGVVPAHTLMVGDSEMDMQMGRAAQAAGCIGLQAGGPHSASLRSADVVVQALQHIQVSCCSME